jgi:hypothetical protein
MLVPAIFKELLNLDKSNFPVSALVADVTAAFN